MAKTVKGSKPVKIEPKVKDIEVKEVEEVKATKAPEKKKKKEEKGKYKWFRGQKIPV